jgi:hypothetical protein
MAFLPSSDTITQVIVAAPVPDIGTSTVLVSSKNPAMETESITWTATVTAQSGTAYPTGHVQFYVDGVAFGPLVAIGATTNYVDITAPALSVGNHQVEARYVP